MKRKGRLVLGVCVGISLALVSTSIYSRNDAGTGTTMPPRLVPMSTPLIGKHVTVEYSEVQQLHDALFEAIDPKLRENSYYPEFVREKISWLLTELEQGRIEKPTLQPTPYLADRKMALAVTGPSNDGQRYLKVQAGTLWHWIREEGKTRTGFSKIHKDSFALVLVHEALHLQLPTMSNTPSLEEEIRVHHAVAKYATRPMLEAGIALDGNLTEDAGAFAQCNYAVDCPAGRALIMTKTGLTR